MENQENKEKKTCCSCKQDMKTFLIALLTSVIVVAVYHIGSELYRIYCPDSSECSLPVCTKYVLVPVQAMPPCDRFCPGMGGKKFQRFGRFCGERKRHGMKQPGPDMNCPDAKCRERGMERPDMNGPELPPQPVKPAPAVK